MSSRITNCGAVGKTVDFLDVATFFDTKPSCFNFEIHICVGYVVLSLKEAKGLISRNLKC